MIDVGTAGQAIHGVHNDIGVVQKPASRLREVGRDPTDATQGSRELLQTNRLTGEAAAGTAPRDDLLDGVMRRLFVVQWSQWEQPDPPLE